MKMNKAEIKELEEKEQVEKFFKTKVGQEWYEELGVVDCVKSETPDFKIKTVNGDTIALEITKFIAENKNLKFSQALTRIGNKICREAEKEYNLHINILIDKYDDREFSIRWKEHLNYAYNSGFSELPDAKIFKQKLQDILRNNIEKLRKGSLVQVWIQVDNEHFKISMDPIACPWTGKYDCHVNNAGMVKQNPIDELQICIDKKNDKILSYSKDCTKCYLLIIVPNAYNANYCSFDNLLLKHRFNSKFKKVFLYSENSNISFTLNN